MNDRHLALVVEDDDAAAEDLIQLASSMGFDVVRTDNRADASRLMKERAVCLVLLDLEIKDSRDSIRGYRIHGRAFLREVRERYGGNRASMFWTPIIVISGHANEVEDAVTMMDDGADYVIRKVPRLDEVEARVRKAMDLAGRGTHAACCAATVSQVDDGRIRLRISGERVGKRATVRLSAGCAVLSASAMKVLLLLAVARQKGAPVHKTVLGAKPNEGFRAISRLREQLRPAVGNFDIVDNDHHGCYTLKPEVLVVECDADALKAMRDREIDRVAAELTATLKASAQ